MEAVLGLILRFPEAIQLLGRFLVWLSGGMIILGWRLGERIDRLEHRASRVGASLDLHLEKILPWWLAPFVPETWFGYGACIALGVAGVLLAIAAKRIKRVLG